MRRIGKAISATSLVLAAAVALGGCQTNQQTGGLLGAGGGALFGGLVVTETIFSIPGMGRLFVQALVSGDAPIVLAWLLIAAVFVILFNLIADLAYRALDPRIRLS